MKINSRGKFWSLFCEIAGFWKTYGKTKVIIRKNNLRRV